MLADCDVKSSFTTARTTATATARTTPVALTAIRTVEKRQKTRRNGYNHEQQQEPNNNPRRHHPVQRRWHMAHMSLFVALFFLTQRCFGFIVVDNCNRKINSNSYINNNVNLFATIEAQTTKSLPPMNVGSAISTAISTGDGERNSKRYPTENQKHDDISVKTTTTTTTTITATSNRVSNITEAQNGVHRIENPKISCGTHSANHDGENYYGTFRAESMLSSISKSLQEVQNNSITAADILESSSIDTMNTSLTGGTVQNTDNFKHIAAANVLDESCNDEKEEQRPVVPKKLPTFANRANSFGRRSLEQLQQKLGRNKYGSNRSNNSNIDHEINSSTTGRISRHGGGKLKKSIMHLLRRTASNVSSPIANLSMSLPNNNNNKQISMNRADGRRRRRRTLSSSIRRKSVKLNDNDIMTNIPHSHTAMNVESTIEDMLEMQKKRIQQMNDELSQTERQLYENGGALGFISREEEIMRANISLFPKPGTVLINSYARPLSTTTEARSSKSFSDDDVPTTLMVGPQQEHEQVSQKFSPVITKRITSSSSDNNNKSPITIRVATVADDVDIANLRLSVFSDFSPSVRQQFCAQSCKAITNRRMKGATCLVATVPINGSGFRTSSSTMSNATSDACDDISSFSITNTNDNNREERTTEEVENGGRASEIIVGSAECSFHEFCGTELGRRRQPNSILYVTEVAVRPSYRQQGIGHKLMEGMDQIAALRKIQTVYLHVDVMNRAAHLLYNRAGYRKVPSTKNDFDTMLYDFTKSLNLHDGATKGRNHFLLCKDIVPKLSWMDKNGNNSKKNRSTTTDDRVATLGFEIPEDL